MSFFIGKNGKVYSDKSPTGKCQEKFDSEQYGVTNCFDTRTEATYQRDLIEDYHPRVFLWPEKL